MSSTPINATENTPSEVPTDLLDLTAAIESLPVEHRIKLLPSLRKVTESSVRRRRILSLVQDALGQLRLDMKYLVFDLEATKRERDAVLDKLAKLDDDSDA